MFSKGVQSRLEIVLTDLQMNGQTDKKTDRHYYKSLRS